MLYQKKYLTNKHLKILGQAIIYPNKHCNTIFVKIHPILKSYCEKGDPDFWNMV